MKNEKVVVVSESRIGKWVSDQHKLAPTRLRFRLSRVEGAGNEITITELENGALAPLCHGLESAMTSDLLTLQGSQSYRLYALGAEQSVLASLTVRGKGSGAEDGGNGGLNPALAKLVGEAFAQTAEHQRQHHDHAMAILADERQEIRDLRQTIRDLERENLELHVAKARWEASTTSAGNEEIWRLAGEAVKALPGTIAIAAKALKGGNIDAALPAAANGSSSLTPIREAAAKLTDEEIGLLLKVIISHPEIHSELEGALHATSKLEIGMALKKVQESLIHAQN